MAALLLATAGMAADLSGGLGDLTGVRDVYILVEGLHEEGARRSGLSSAALRTTLEAGLVRSNTVRVVAPGTEVPYIYLNVGVMPLDGAPNCVYTVRLALDESALVTRGEQVVRVYSAQTWHAMGTFGVARDGDVSSVVRDAIGRMVDQFTVKWARDNPRE
jgi:hypothetical protein